MARFTQKLLVMLAPAEAFLLQFLAETRNESKLQVLRDALRYYAKHANPQGLGPFEAYLQQRLAELSPAHRTPEVERFSRDLCNYLYGRPAGRVLNLSGDSGSVMSKLPSVASILG